MITCTFILTTLLTTLCAVNQLKTAYFNKVENTKKPHKHYIYKHLCGF